MAAVSTNTVPVNTSATTDAYSGFNIHVGTTVSAGVVVTSISGDDTGSTLNVLGGTFCQTAVPASGEFVIGCIPLEGQSTTAAGLLATLTFNTTGDGCVVASLLTGFTDVFLRGRRRPLNTYTTNDADNSQQSVSLERPGRHPRRHWQSSGDCVLPTATPTDTPTVTNTPLPTEHADADADTDAVRHGRLPDGVADADAGRATERHADGDRHAGDRDVHRHRDGHPRTGAASRRDGAAATRARRARARRHSPARHGRRIGWGRIGRGLVRGQHRRRGAAAPAR